MSRSFPTGLRSARYGSKGDREFQKKIKFVSLIKNLIRFVTVTLSNSTLLIFLKFNDIRTRLNSIQFKIYSTRLLYNNHLNT